MKNRDLAPRIKNLRNRKGFSQEVLSERTGLSLRTIQRIENGETKPRGDSLKRLAFAFDVPPDEINDWTVQEDKGFLTTFNLSALSFLFFPLLGILVPLIIWTSKKDKIKDLNTIAKDLLNFQITWSILLFMGHISIFLSSIYELQSTGLVSPSIILSRIGLNFAFIGIMYCYNLIMIVINSIRIKHEKNTVYFPKVRFLRK